VGKTTKQEEESQRKESRAVKVASRFGTYHPIERSSVTCSSEISPGSGKRDERRKGEGEGKREKRGRESKVSSRPSFDGNDGQTNNEINVHRPERRPEPIDISSSRKFGGSCKRR